MRTGDAVLVVDPGMVADPSVILDSALAMFGFPGRSYRRRVTSLPDGYRLVNTAPSLEAYLHLRQAAGLTSRSAEQSRAGLPGSWFACHVVCEASGETVAMGRLIGDGGWYFHVVDMAVLPEYQRRGLGGVVLRELLHQIRLQAPPGASVNLLADAPGRALYRQHGFVETAPYSIGMELATD